LALVATGEILTNCVDATGRLLSKLHALVNISAFTGLMVARVTALTNAHAAAHEFVFNALLSSRAGCIGTTHVRCFRFLTTAAIRIARHATRTLTRERTGLIVTDRARRTRVYRAFIDVSTTTLYSGLSGVTVATEACRYVVQEHAMRIGSTRQVFAWI